MNRELILIIVVIISIVLMINAFYTLNRLNKKYVIKSTTKYILIYIIALIPILGFFITRNLAKNAK